MTYWIQDQLKTLYLNVYDIQKQHGLENTIDDQYKSQTFEHCVQTNSIFFDPTLISKFNNVKLILEVVYILKFFFISKLT